MDKIKLTKEQAKVMDNLCNEAEKKGYINNLDGAFGFKMGYMVAFDLCGVVKSSYCYAVNVKESEECKQQCLGCSMKQKRLGQ